MADKLCRCDVSRISTNTEAGGWLSQNSNDKILTSGMTIELQRSYCERLIDANTSIRVGQCTKWQGNAGMDQRTDPDQIVAKLEWWWTV